MMIQPFQNRAGEAQHIAKALGINPSDNPSIMRMIGTLLQEMPAVKKHTQNPRMRDEVIEADITRPLLRQFNAIRIHTRPFYMHADEIGEEVYCAIIMVNYGRHVWKDSRACAEDESNPQWDNIRGAINILSVVHEFDNTAGVSPNDFARMPFEGQIVIMAHACYTAERFLDMLKMNAEKTDFHLDRQGIDMAFGVLTTYDQLLAPHLSGLANCYRRLMDVVRLERDRTTFLELQAQAQPRGLITMDSSRPANMRLN